MKITYVTIIAVALFAAGAIANETGVLGWGQAANRGGWSEACRAGQVACSADGKTVYLIVHACGVRDSGKLLVSRDGGGTWAQINQ